MHGFLFSEELNRDLRSYWLRRFGEELSPEKAEQYLAVLAELYLNFRDIEQDMGGRSFPPSPPFGAERNGRLLTLDY